MYEIAILNPRKRRRRKTKAGKRARRSTGVKTMAKRRRKLSAKQIAAGFGGKRRKAPKRRKSHAKRRKVHAKRRPAVGYVSGPRRIRRRKLNPRRRHHVAVARRRRRHNPRFSVSGVVSQLMPATYGAAGGIALDVGLGYVSGYLPAMLTTGYAKHATRIGGALGIGWLGRKFLGAKGDAMGKGALIVAIYGLLKDVVVQFAPGVKGLGDYEMVEIDSTASDLGAYLPGSPVGAYLPDGSSAPGMGAYLAGADENMDTAGGVVSGFAGLDY